MNERMIIDDVRDQYAGVAKGALTNESTAVRSIASAFGYSEDELNQLPAEANMGLSCGNPLALAGIREGEVVVDLGCGGGMDVFLAARKVGSSGRAIGIDMTAEMLERARSGQQKLGLTNVEFHQSTIDKLPLPDNSVDCVISNCVINLVPDKSAVFREILRVLKPGGRVAISDIALKQELPSEVKQSVEAYVGCISGAILIDEYRSLLEQAGFASVVVTDTGSDLNAYAMASDGGCCGGGSCDADEKSLHDGLASIMQSFDANAFAASVRVHALKQPSANTVNTIPTLNLQPISRRKP
jgi:arsenite methyltransferase